jgi:hypothetical protein
MTHARLLLVFLSLAFSASVLSGCTETPSTRLADSTTPQLFASQAGACNNKVFVSKNQVAHSTNANGWTAIDIRTDQLVRVSGDAIILDASPQQIKTYKEAPSDAEAQRRLNELIQKDGTILVQPAQCAPTPR